MNKLIIVIYGVHFRAVRGESSPIILRSPKMLRFATNYNLNKKFHPPNLLDPHYCYPRTDTDNTYLTTTVIFIIVMTRFLKNVPNYTLQVFRTTNLKYIDILISNIYH